LVTDTISITLDKDMIKEIDKIVNSGASPFKSRSALIQYYLKRSPITEFYMEQEISVVRPKKG